MKVDFKLYKNNNLIINENGIAYSKKDDRILFELGEDHFNILIDNVDFELSKENSENIFVVKNNESTLYFKEKDLMIPIIVESFEYYRENNKYIIKYQLETDDEQTTIEIIL